MLIPASLAARASERLRSWSTAYWASNEPAWALVVPNAEMNTVGVGWMLLMLVGHVDVSFDMMPLT